MLNTVQHRAFLAASWGTLYELTKLPDDQGAGALGLQNQGDRSNRRSNRGAITTKRVGNKKKQLRSGASETELTSERSNIGKKGRCRAVANGKCAMFRLSKRRALIKV
jgi:hypothetical protein